LLLTYRGVQTSQKTATVVVLRGGAEMSRQERWEKNLEMLKSGALGDDASPKTLLRYWKMQERAGYPNASENVKYFEEIARKESEVEG
jgi:hypothetical protein